MQLISIEASQAEPVTLLAMLNESLLRRRRRRVRLASRDTALPTPHGTISCIRPSVIKGVFLVELEVTGSIRAAAQAAGCSVRQALAWRAADPKFARDFTLAVLGHLKVLKLIVTAVAQSHPDDSVRRTGRSLLAQEEIYRDSDGLLDVYSWCGALRAFTDSLELDIAEWDPSSGFSSSNRTSIFRKPATRSRLERVS